MRYNDIDKQIIKRRYLSGEMASEICKDYVQTDITQKVIENWIKKEKWKLQKDSMYAGITKDIEKKIADSSDLAINKLTHIIKTSKSESNIIAAARAILDCSGLKKQENINKNKTIDKEEVENITNELGLNYKNSDNQKSG